MFVGAADGSVLLRTANDDGSYGDTDDVFALASEAYLSAAGGSGLGALRTLSGRSHVALPLALSGLASVAVGAGFFPFLPMVPGLGASAGASAWVHGTYAAPSCADLDGNCHRPYSTPPSFLLLFCHTCSCFLRKVLLETFRGSSVESKFFINFVTMSC